MPALRLSLLALAALALSGSSSVAAQLQQRSSSLAAADAHALVARVADAAFNSAYLASNYQNGSAPPNAREGDAAGQTVILSTVGGSDDDSQVPDCSTIFIGSAVVAGSADGGWQALPQLVGFELDRSLVINGATQVSIALARFSGTGQWVENGTEQARYPSCLGDMLRPGKAVRPP
jgi:hypothetical protein